MIVEVSDFCQQINVCTCIQWYKKTPHQYNLFLGADFVQIGRTYQVYSCLVKLLAQSNGLSDHISFRYLEPTGMFHSQVVWDIVVCDMVNPQGELRAGVLEELAYIRLKF